MIGRINVFFALLLAFQLSFSQESPPLEDVLNELRTDTRFEDGGLDWIQFSEQLINLKSQSISLNLADLQELLQIPFINKIQAFNLIQYRRKSGSIKSYYELLSVKGFSKKEILWLMPFTNLKTRREEIRPKDVFKNGKHQFASKLARVTPTKRGFQNRVYAGDPNQIYYRYRLNYQNRIFAGITLQKDEGEKWIHNNLPDYYSYHLEYRSSGFIKKIILGDYLTNYGQGLGLWTSFSFGKMAETTEIQRFGKGISYYSGANESRFFRGAALRFGNNHIICDLFYSQNNLDATIQKGNITSVNESGYHRTLSELNRYKNANIKVAGGHIQWFQNYLEIGSTAYYYEYSHPFIPTHNLYNIHAFKGLSNYVFSLDYQWSLGKHLIFGELSRSQNGGSAFITSIKSKPIDPLIFTLSYRNFHKTYQTLYSAPFSESGKSGETGFYFGLQYRFNQKWNLKFYLDHFDFDWLQYYSSNFSNGRDVLTQLEYNPNRDLKFYLRFRIKEELEDDISNHKIPEANYSTKKQMRAHLSFRISQNLLWTSRIDFNTFINQNKYQGFLIYQDLSFAIPKSRFSIDTRICFFDSDHGNSMVYALEDDVPYSFSLESFSKNGSKYYILVKYAFRRIDLYIKYGVWHFPHENSISSGNNEIIGNQMQEFKFVVRFKL